MPTFPRDVSQQAIERKLKEGRGSGEKESYLSWIYTHEISSFGLSTVAWSYKLNREVHLLSQGELKLFYVVEYSQKVLDFWENYPFLDIDAALKIAHEHGIKYPFVQRRNEPWISDPYVVTTDLMLTVANGNGYELRPLSFKYARTKYGNSKDNSKHTLEDDRTLEKLELERLILESVGHKLQIMTELDIPDAVFMNLKQAHYHYKLEDLEQDAIKEIATFLTKRVKLEKTPLRKITSNCDRQLGYQEGEGISLSVVWHLIANHKWVIDLTKLLEPNSPLELISSTI